MELIQMFIMTKMFNN